MSRPGSRRYSRTAGRRHFLLPLSAIAGQVAFELFPGHVLKKKQKPRFLSLDGASRLLSCPSPIQDEMKTLLGEYAPSRVSFMDGTLMTGYEKRWKVKKARGMG